jgi:hypothetical protein
MPNILLDPLVKEDVILDIVAMFMNHDIDIAEAQEISAAAIEALKVARNANMEAIHFALAYEGVGVKG